MGVNIVSNTKGILWKTKTYLVGHIQYQNGRDWRNYVSSQLMPRGITCLDPYHKPFVDDVSEDETVRSSLLASMEEGDYDKVAQRMWPVRSFDLRCVDLSDFLIAHISPSIASWGSAEELTVAVKEKKVIFLSVEGGKKKTPLWIMGMLPHKYIYNSIEESVEMVKMIDDGIVAIDSGRWKLLQMQYR